MDTQAWIDQHDANIAAMIRRYGWYIAYVGGGECSCPGCDGGEVEEAPFAYTVGLFGLAHPELLIFGVGSETASGVLNSLGDRSVHAQMLEGASIQELEARWQPGLDAFASVRQRYLRY